MHWQTKTSDPNSPEIINQRKQAIKAAKQQPVTDRLAYLCELATGKNVLDVGVIDHVSGKQHSADWLHGALAKVAGKISGVDILPEAVEKLKQEGYNVRLADITKEPLQEKFDVIIVGEVIEHLGNPGALFESAAKMLNQGGKLILTTPNPYFIFRVRDNLWYGFGSDSVDHVTFLFPFGIAEFAERAGMRLSSWRGFLASPPSNIVKKLLIALLKLLLSQESFCNALIYECTL